MMNKSLFKNFFSLGLIQIFGFIAPIITAPYVIRIIGIEQYGTTSIGLSIATFFIVFCDYGFNLSATREVSLNRDDKKKLSEIVSKVIISKGIIVWFCALIYLILVFNIKYFSKDIPFFLYSFLLVLGQCFLPTWFFQGLEEMKYITYLSLLSKLIGVCAIFFFIKEGSDYIFINAISGISSLFASVFGLYLIYVKYNVGFCKVSVNTIFKELKEGFLIFLSNISNVVYTFSNIIILDLIVKDRGIVGSYSVAEKMLTVCKQILIVYSQVVYPHLCNLAKGGLQNVIKFLRTNFLAFFLMIFIGSLLMFVLSDWIIYFISGEIDLVAIDILRMFSILPIIISLNIPSYQILLVYNSKKDYSTIYGLAAIISVFSNFLLTFEYSYTGTIISIIITEVFITAGLFIVLKSKNLNPIT